MFSWNKQTYKNKVVVITGASSGIGRSVALRVACVGAKIALIARRVDKLQETKKLCVKSGAEVVCYPCDLTVQSAVQIIFNKLEAQWGEIHLLVNNAGVSGGGEFGSEKSFTDFELLTSINYSATVHCTHCALPLLKKTGGTVFVNCSFWGLCPQPLLAAYSGSKFALRGFFDAFRHELKQHGVHVCVAYIAGIDTEMSSGNISSAKCANMFIRALLLRHSEVYVPQTNWSTYIFRTLCPQYTDRIAHEWMHDHLASET